uniref:Uncharacterized protein n=1 Tax=Plectus sambesii TaxID=2011161 RepID=A0A914VFM4_9BILA
MTTVVDDDWPKVSFISASAAKDDAERETFFENYVQFLTKARHEGVNKDGTMQPQVEKFDRLYRLSIQPTVHSVMGTIEVFSQSILKSTADLMNVCLDEIVPKMESPGLRTKGEEVMDEICAQTLMGQLLVLENPDCDPRLVVNCVDSCYPLLLRYTLAVTHKCHPPDECQCYQRCGPRSLEDAIETVTLIVAANNSPEMAARHLPTLLKHYANAISFKFTLMLAQLYDRFSTDVEKCFGKIMIDLTTLLNASMDSDKSSMIFMIGGTIMHTKPAPTDVVFVALDKLARKIAERNPKFLKKDHVDLIERFYIEKRPAHRSAIDILGILALKYSDAMKGRGEKYYQVAKELELNEREIDVVSAIFLTMAMVKDKKEGQRWLDLMSRDIKKVATDDSDMSVKRSILASWCNLPAAELKRIEQFKPEIANLEEVSDCAQSAQTLLQRMTDKNQKKRSILSGGNRSRSGSMAPTNSKMCTIL